MQSVVLTLFLAAAGVSAQAEYSQSSDPNSNVVQIGDGQLQAPALPVQQQYPAQTAVPGVGTGMGSGVGTGMGSGVGTGTGSGVGPGVMHPSAPLATASCISVSPNTMCGPFATGTSPAYGSMYGAPCPTGMSSIGGYPMAGTGGVGCATGGVIAPQPQASILPPMPFEGSASKYSDGWGLMVLAVFAGIVAVGMI
jgi:hypothetical protein